jgi:hypothetical protein
MTTTKLRLLGADLLIVSVYWPFSSWDPGHYSLEEKLRRWLRSQGSTQTPSAYIEDLTGTTVADHRGRFIIAGDFNTTSTSPKFKDWLAAYGIVDWAADGEISAPTRWSGDTSTADIDHILADPESPIATYSVLTAFDVTDHSPVLASFLLPNATTGPAQPLPEAVPSRPERKSKAWKDWFTRKAHRWVASNEDLPPEDFIQQLSLSLPAIAATSRQTHDKPRKTLNGWSPQALYLQDQIVFVQSVKRHLRGSRGYKKWCPRDVPANLRSAIDAWLCRATTHEWDGKGSPGCFTLTLYPPAFWRALPLHTLDVACETALLGLQRMLSRRHRRKFRRFINEAVSAREKSATTGKLAKALGSLLQKPRPQVDFGYIEIPGRGAAIGPADTHAAITDYLAEWHRADPALHDRDWEDFFATKEGFLRQMEGSPVPRALLDRIWDAFTPTLPEAELARMTQEMNDALSLTPSFEEFRLTLARKTTKGKAAGPSGTTYGMLALLDEADLRVLYTAMARMWEAREVPALWKLRWMVPISKVPIEPSIDQLRPISLVETSRKLWYAMIVNRIRSAWHDYGALSDLQHGSRPCRGTDSASIQFINAIEECHVSCTPLFASSWDIRRAFDSLPKPLLCFAWTRLGVPLDIAQMIVAADTDGVTVVKSPTAVLAMSKEGPVPFLSAAPQFRSLWPRRAWGRGTSPRLITGMRPMTSC